MTERMMSIPESPSVICADLPVREESLNSVHMAQTEGKLWGELLVVAVVAAVCYFTGTSPFPDPDPCPPDEEPCSIDPDPEPCPPDIAEIMDPCDD